MFTCTVENKSGNTLTLTQNESDFQVAQIEGLNPPSAQINLTKLAEFDGARFNSATLNTREIVLYVRLNGDVEANRIRLYSFFRTKQPIKFYYTNDTRDVYIEGYVETVDCDLFTNSEIMQVTIICPQPFFRGIEEMITDISKSDPLFEFPFAINKTEPVVFSELNAGRNTNIHNQSEIETGLIIEINVLDTCNKIKIQNINTGEFIQLDYEFQAGDFIEINTNRGEKSVRLTRSATTTNLFKALSKSSVFFQLDVGDNIFNYLVNDGAKDGAVEIVFKYYTLYGGV